MRALYAVTRRLVPRRKVGTSRQWGTAAERRRAHTSACCRSCSAGPSRRHFIFSKRARLRLSPTGTGSIGRIVSSTLVAIVILDVPFDVGGAHDDSTISPLLSGHSRILFLTAREAMILPARILYTCVEERTRLIYSARFAMPVEAFTKRCPSCCARTLRRS